MTSILEITRLPLKFLLKTYTRGLQTGDYRMYLITVAAVIFLAWFIGRITVWVRCYRDTTSYYVHGCTVFSWMSLKPIKEFVNTFRYVFLFPLSLIFLELVFFVICSILLSLGADWLSVVDDISTDVFEFTVSCMLPLGVCGLMTVLLNKFNPFLGPVITLTALGLMFANEFNTFWVVLLFINVGLMLIGVIGWILNSFVSFSKHTFCAIKERTHYRWFLPVRKTPRHKIQIEKIDINEFANENNITWFDN